MLKLFQPATRLMWEKWEVGTRCQFHGPEGTSFHLHAFLPCRRRRREKYKLFSKTSDLGDFSRTRTTAVPTDILGLRNPRQTPCRLQEVEPEVVSSAGSWQTRAGMSKAQPDKLTLNLSQPKRNNFSMPKRPSFSFHTKKKNKHCISHEYMWGRSYV